MKENVAPTSTVVNYDDRVEIWFLNPAKALAQKGYADSDPRRIHSIPFHNFAKEVDKYALKWGYEKTIKNKLGRNAKVVCVPGIIEKDGRKYEGLFIYAIDSMCLCYHRFFHECEWHSVLADQWNVTIDSE